MLTPHPDPEKSPLEEQLLGAIDTALGYAREIRDRHGARQNSLAVTHLEDAKFRAVCDIEEKSEAPPCDCGPNEGCSSCSPEKFAT
jgi:hypothetical protein